MSVNTTAQPGIASAGTTAPAPAVDQARAAWATASRDSELARWHELYDAVVSAPQTAMTTAERYAAGWPARDSDERTRYRELDQCSARPEAEPEAGR
jgi:hypothetical protein